MCVPQDLQRLLWQVGDKQGELPSVSLRLSGKAARALDLMTMDMDSNPYSVRHMTFSFRLCSTRSWDREDGPLCRLCGEDSRQWRIDVISSLAHMLPECSSTFCLPLVASGARHVPGELFPQPVAQ